MHVSLSRAVLLRTLAVLPAATLAPPAARAIIGEITGPGFVQSDDKSWDVTLPPSWTPSSDLRAEHPKHLFHLRATRSGGGASAEIIVDKCKGTSLKELGKLEAVGQRFAPPSAEMTSAAQVPGAIKGSSYYQYTYSSAAGTSRLKLSVQQNRLYSLAITLPTSPSAEVETEAAAILSSFKSFPVNIFCLSASNGGTAPTPGTCY